MSLLDRSDSSELVVLSLLSEAPSYGYQLTKEAASRSDGQVRLTPGVLYPMLKKLERDGLISSSWEEVKAAESEPGEAGRRRKWYRLSPKGKRRLEQHAAAHRAYTALIEAFLNPERARGGEA